MQAKALSSRKVVLNMAGSAKSFYVQNSQEYPQCVYLGQMSTLLACNLTCNAKWYLLEKALVESYL